MSNKQHGMWKNLPQRAVTVIKRLLKRHPGPGTKISTQGTIPKELTNTQEMFLRWNAERLGISLEESRLRYFSSWSAIRKGHAGSYYKLFSTLSYRLFNVFFSNTANEIYTAYQSHSYMHFLRMLSYPEHSWTISCTFPQNCRFFATGFLVCPMK